MASDYEAIKTDNQRRYGTDVERYGKSLLTDLYDDRTHFIYELLQNAEDALRRRDDEPPSRTVRFDLAEHALRISHYGKPFDRDDVEGVCGIALSTRDGDLTRIGRFGIGFKSVYGFTDRPEIHSGDEDFGIDKFVWPSAQRAIERDPDQTVFVMPLRDPAGNGTEIAGGLRRINLDTLLFLREIDTIEWSIPTGETGKYVRQSEPRAEHVRRVALIGASNGHDVADQEWRVFSKPMYGDGQEPAGHVEIAFFMKGDRVRPVSRSRLVVFFPTAVETNLGLRVQGPYRTTPSRENVPKFDPWNQKCVEKTGELLVDALLWLRKGDRLDVEVLRCLPLDAARFGDDSMFQSLYATIKSALCSKKLLPVLGGGHARAGRVKLGRSRELRELFSVRRLKQLFGATNRVSWLTDLISQDRTPELRRYLMEELGVEEVTPQTMLPRLCRSFLGQQSNAWMCRLYEFLNGQAALHRQAKVAPLMRLSTGAHVPAIVNGTPEAFLPGAVETGFPTVHKRACQSADARQFLGAIGLSEPHPVDDVIRNVLPKYREKDVWVADAEYETDIRRILEAASRKDSSEKRLELIKQLRDTPFVRATHTGDETECLASPAELHLATDRLKALLAGISGHRVVDERCNALGAGGMRELLEKCGAARHLRPVKKDEAAWSSSLSEEFLAKLRDKNGHSQTSRRTDTIGDWELAGLEEVIARLPHLSVEDQRIRAKYIWEELAQLEERRGKAVFRAEYCWTDYGKFRQEFDAAFIRRLNDSAWIPGTDGGLQRPNVVLFESLGWRDNPFVLSKILFKPPIVDQLAHEAGFEPAMLDELKALGITSSADLKALGITSWADLVERLRDQREEHNAVNSPRDALAALGVTPPRRPTVEDPSAEPNHADHVSTVPTNSGGHFSSSGSSQYRELGTGGAFRPRMSAGRTASTGRTTFVSYVAVGVKDERDPDGLVHEERMALEEDAIKRILSRDQRWERTPMNNEGFDLVQVADDQVCAWCEVKAMKGSLHDRPVGMSHAQFKWAQQRGDAYWLYIVEHAGSDEARIVRIQDPAGKAKTFTFDKGWLPVAEDD